MPLKEVAILLRVSAHTRSFEERFIVSDADGNAIKPKPKPQKLASR